jgi:hypothetical protein
MIKRIYSFVTSGKILFCLLFLGCLDVGANNNFYGRIAIDAQSISIDNNGTKSDIANNESKAGLKGSFLFSESSNLQFIYQIEYGFDPVDGKARGDDGTLKQRNTFIGLQSNFGTLFAGTHDSALKKSQLQVDLFNDVSADIKNIFHGENRLEEFIGFTTPKYKDSISATFNHIKNPLASGANFQSYSINYSGDKYQAAFAVDDDMKGFDSTRFSVLYPHTNFRLGIIVQVTKNLLTGLKKSGGVVSYSAKIQAKGTLKFQHASSSIKISSGKQSTIGYDHQIKQGLKFFTLYSKLQSDMSHKNRNIFSIGLEYKF